MLNERTIVRGVPDKDADLFAIGNAVRTLAVGELHRAIPHRLAY